MWFTFAAVFTALSQQDKLMDMMKQGVLDNDCWAIIHDVCKDIGLPEGNVSGIRLNRLQQDTADRTRLGQYNDLCQWAGRYGRANEYLFVTVLNDYRKMAKKQRKVYRTLKRNLVCILCHHYCL